MKRGMEEAVVVVIESAREQERASKVWKGRVTGEKVEIRGAKDTKLAGGLADGAWLGPMGLKAKRTRETEGAGRTTGGL